ncbi:penicillin-binding transpeptidase domain-containing protein [Cytobacillus sp. Hz8]|uniref:penicillin-binding transpeptidase domain-containing protein n=1 Tax=Cytobacillus sp. Hz8 TaxID=3347168 RepID=UPI0035D767BA
MLKKKNKKDRKKTHLPFRLNVLFFTVFLLFSILILRLGMVQIVYGDDYKREIERTDDKIINVNVPRGKMFDRHGKTIVDNRARNAITYTNRGASQEEMIQCAERLAKLIDVKSDKVRERDEKDYWIIRNPNRARAKITESEWEQFKQKKLDDEKIYQLQLERITKNELKELTKQDIEVLAIFRIFNSGYSLTPQIVKNENVTKKEFAEVSENLEYLPGVDTTTDWNRTYKNGATLKTVLGKVTNSDEGLPEERVNYYLSRGYNRNDRVGKSYLELQYEDVLHGQRAKVMNKTDKMGNVIETKQVSKGKRGKDLVLTIDMNLQQEVDKIIEKELWKLKRKPATDLLDRAFVVLMDPDTGEILAMSGKQITKDDKTGKMEMADFALGNITTAYNAGSAVKGATVLTGYDTGAIQPGTILYDTPLLIKGTPPKKSWKNMGNVNDLTAIKMSSNVYMFRTAIAIGKGIYTPHEPLNLDVKAFETIRDHFSQFGLGVRTGIDLPNEQIGFKGSDTKPGFLLDLVIGQFDMYTPMQMAQYVSTIANGGYRIQPHLVKEIRDPLEDSDKLGPISEEMDPKILNRIDMKTSWVKRVQEGFRQVMQSQGGTATSYFGSKSYKPAGKTGTAQAFYDGPERYKMLEPKEVMNVSLVSYAPFNDPEVAMAVIVPWAYTGNTGPSPNLDIGEKVFDKYFELQKKQQSID